MAGSNDSRSVDSSSTDTNVRSWREFWHGLLGLYALAIGVPLAAAAIVGFTRGSLMVLGACVLLSVVPVLLMVLIALWGRFRFRYLRKVSIAVESHKARAYGGESPTSSAIQPDRAIAAASGNQLLRDLNSIRVPRGVRTEFTELLASVSEFERACNAGESLEDANVRIRKALDGLWTAAPDRVIRFVDRHLGGKSGNASSVEASG